MGHFVKTSNPGTNTIWGTFQLNQLCVASIQGELMGLVQLDLISHARKAPEDSLL